MYLLVYNYIDCALTPKKETSAKFFPLSFYQTIIIGEMLLKIKIYYNVDGIFQAYRILFKPEKFCAS